MKVNKEWFEEFITRSTHHYLLRTTYNPLIHLDLHYLKGENYECFLGFEISNINKADRGGFVCVVQPASYGGSNAFLWRFGSFLLGITDFIGFNKDDKVFTEVCEYIIEKTDFEIKFNSLPSNFLANYFKTITYLMSKQQKYTSNE